MKKDLSRVNIFQDRRASREFYIIMMRLQVLERTKFSQLVRELFDRKTVSEEGEYKTFKVTVEDIQTIKASMLQVA